MNMSLKNFLIKLSVFLAFVFFFQFIVYRFSIDEEFLNKDVFDNLIKKNADIVYFGDSSLESWDIHDQNKSTTSDMLQDLWPHYPILTVKSHGYHLGRYEEFYMYFRKKQYHPKLIIVLINLRSFSPQWDANPSYQFEKQRIILNYDSLLFRIFFRPLAIFKVFNFEEIKNSQYLNTKVYNSQTLVGKVEDFDNPTYNYSSEANIKNKIIFHYMFPLDKTHRKLQSMVNLIKDHQLNVLFYITPIDYQTGEQYLGAAFREQVAQDIKLIKLLLDQNNAKYIDLSFSLDASYFAWQQQKYPNEHLKEAGREFVAQQLSHDVLNQLQKKP